MNQPNSNNNNDFEIVKDIIEMKAKIYNIEKNFDHHRIDTEKKFESQRKEMKEDFDKVYQKVDSVAIIINSIDDKIDRINAEKMFNKGFLKSCVMWTSAIVASAGIIVSFAKFILPLIVVL